MKRIILVLSIATLGLAFPACDWFAEAEDDIAAEPSEDTTSIPSDTQCTPACAGKVCGDDGCGGSCGSCIGDDWCNHGVCDSTPCTPDCTGKECGDDGCGNSCGNCLQGEECSAGECVCLEGAVKTSPWSNGLTVAAGYEHSCAAHKNGVVYCWGHNEFGQLGYSPRTPTTPQQLLGHPVEGADDGSAIQMDPTQLEAGEAHTCAISKQGQVYCWGRNDQGQLGIGTTADSKGATLVEGLTNIVEISLYLDSTCARSGAGEVWCWGKQMQWEGDATLPTPQPDLEPSKSISLGKYVGAGPGFAICSVKTEGTLWCHGDTIGDGQQGAGEVFDVVEVVVTKEALLTVNEDGSYGAWDGAYVSNTILGESIAHIRCSSYLEQQPTSICAILESGKVACWGDNYSGQLGLGTDEHSVSDPTVLIKLQSEVVTDVEFGSNETYAGSVHTCAVTQTGSVHCWGSNEFGETGSLSTQPPPFQEGAETTSPNPVYCSGFSITITEICNGFDDDCDGCTDEGVCE